MNNPSELPFPDTFPLERALEGLRANIASIVGLPFVDLIDILRHAHSGGTVSDVVVGIVLDEIGMRLCPGR